MAILAVASSFSEGLSSVAQPLSEPDIQFMTQAYSILVNSCDSYEDCWHPFFSLFAKYWPNYKGQIVLNTERKNWPFPGLNIKCAKVQLDTSERKLSWSECLLRALDHIDTPLVLYLQEDYFLERPVNSTLIDEFAELMVRDNSIKHIGLTHFGSQGPFEQTPDERLWKIGKRSAYRVSTQAALWQVETLRSYLRPEENAWMFEIFGTRRARHRTETFLTVNRDLYNPKATPIIQYMHTGIIKGKWHPKIPALFEPHGIKADFEKRGFYKEEHWLTRKVGTLKKLASNPVAFVRGMAGY